MAKESYNEAVYEVVHRSGMPIKQLAALLGMAESYLYNCANVNQEEPTLPRKQIIPATVLTGNFAILDHFEHACGRVAFEIPKAAGPLSRVTAEVSKVTLEFGHLLKEVSEALADDGRVDEQELVTVKLKCRDLHRALARLEAAAKKEAED